MTSTPTRTGVLRILGFSAVAALTGALATLQVSTPARAATPVHKCVIDGTVTFQSDPCPSGQARPAPTVQQLNAEERRRRDAASAARGASPPPSRAGTGAPGATPAAVQPGSRPQEKRASSEAPARSTPGFRCDGRRHCSQMTSCAEAKYFLSNCPGVEMDGDGDGIPCERQWCNR